MSRAQFIRRMIFDGRGAPLPPPARPQPADWLEHELTGSCLGHSSVLLNFFGVWIITDPVFSSRVGPGLGPLVAGPKRYHLAALSSRQVPAPDAIVLSHAHFDHFDRPSLRRFRRDTPVVTAAGRSDLLRRFHHVHELEWGEHVVLETRRDLLRVEAIEVNHWGTRLLRDHHRGYNGHVFEREGHRVCFAGDTADTDTFAQLRRSRSTLDLILMPIGAYNPWIRAHCSPEQAARMAREAGARHFVPIHHETFKLSAEPMDEPARRIRAAFARAPAELLAVHTGETFRVPL